jgi:hypothetical protein
MISLFKKNTPGSGFDAFGYPVKYRSAKEAGCGVLSIPTAGLIFYAPLNEYSDTAATGQTLNYGGDVTFGTQRGIPCVYFDGSSRIYTDESIGISGNHPVTVSAWFEAIGSYNTWAFVAYFGESQEDGQHCGLGTYSNDIFASGNGYSVETNIDAAGNMHHVALVSDGKSMNLYVDGELVGSTEVPFDIAETIFEIGTQEGDYGCAFNGAISAVRVYDRVLTGEEIKTLSGEFNV